jgi:hypothetical protein
MGTLHDCWEKKPHLVPGFQLPPDKYALSQKQRCYERYNALAKALKEPTISNGLPIGPVKYDRVHTVRVPMPNPVLLDPHALSQLPCVFDFLDHEMVEAVRVMPLVSNGTKCAQ